MLLFWVGAQTCAAGTAVGIGCNEDTEQHEFYRIDLTTGGWSVLSSFILDAGWISDTFNVDAAAQRAYVLSVYNKIYAFDINTGQVRMALPCVTGRVCSWSCDA